MQIKDKVRIIGPACYGDTAHIGDTFTITQSDERMGSPGIYTGKGFAWYPESSLELVTKTFQIGQLVRIIGPDWVGMCAPWIGKEFTIGQMPEKCRTLLGCRSDIDCYSDAGFPMYPASSLELVEELQPGDLVEIIGPGKEGNTVQIGQNFVIGLIHPSGAHYSDASLDMFWYPASSLRKIDPLEKETIGYKRKECEKNIEKATQAVRNILAPLVDKRLEGIEKQCKQFDGEIGALRGNISECLIESGDVDARLSVRCMDIEKQLADLKKAFQEKDMQDEQLNANIEWKLDALNVRLQSLEAWQKEHDQKANDLEKIILSGGIRFGKMASFCDELKKFDWSKEPEYIA